MSKSALVTRLFEEREASDHRTAQPTNPYGTAYMAFAERVGRDIMQSRTIRAWHYTRLTDAELNILTTTGV